MQPTKVEAYQWTCGSCESKGLTLDEHPPQGWLFGTVRISGQPREWAACKTTCIRDAVTNQVDPKRSEARTDG